MSYYWKIPFKDKNEHSFEVRVQKPSGSADTTLIGAAQPFYTEEDSDEDFFKPVRLQSGYIRIVDTGEDANGNAFDWHDFIPTEAVDRPVFLYDTDNNVCLWAGFMQPATFQGDFNLFPQEREFPIACILSALEAFDMELSTSQPVTLGALLYEILVNIPDTVLSDSIYGELDDFIFQGIDAVTKGTDGTGWLYQLISPTILYDMEDDGTLTPKYNCLELLEEVCSFLGLTCRMDGVKVWFVGPSQDIASSNFSTISQQDLMDISNEVEVQSTTTAFTTEALADPFVNTNNSEQILRGVRKVTVTEDVDKIDNIFTLPLDDFKKKLIKDGVGALPGTTFEGGSYNHGQGKVWTRQWPQAVLSTFENYFAKIYLKNYIYSNGTYNQTYAIPYLTDWDDAALEGSTLVKTTFNWMPRLHVFHRSAWDSDNPNYNEPIITIRNPHPVILGQGILVLNMTTQVDDINSSLERKTHNGHGIVYMSIKIGDKYWSEELATWQADPVYIPITTGGSSTATGSGELLSNRLLNGYVRFSGYQFGPFPPFTGYGIPISNGIGGIIQIDIYSSDIDDPSTVGSTTLNDTCFIDITKMTLDFYRGSSMLDWSENDQNEYKRENTSLFTDEIDIQHIMTCDNNNAPGRGLLLTPTRTFTSSFPYTASGGGSQELPGQHLADAVGSFYNQTRRMLELDLKRSTYELTPGHKVTYDGKTYYPISITNDWGEDITTVKLIEL